MVCSPSVFGRRNPFFRRGNLRGLTISVDDHSHAVDFLLVELGERFVSNYHIAKPKRFVLFGPEVFVFRFELGGRIAQILDPAVG